MQHSDEVSLISNEVSLTSIKNSRLYDMMKVHYDQITFLREKLVNVRKTEEYESIFNNYEPLITVRIATYNNAKVLLKEL